MSLTQETMEVKIQVLDQERFTRILGYLRQNRNPEYYPISNVNHVKHEITISQRLDGYTPEAIRARIERVFSIVGDHDCDYCGEIMQSGGLTPCFNCKKNHCGHHYCGEGEDTLGEGVWLSEEEPIGGYY